MKLVLVTAFALLATLSCGGPILDERWEGDATDCSDNVEDFGVIMLLNRSGSSSPGYAGYKQSGSDNNYSVTKIVDPEYGGGTLKFTAEFDTGGASQDWDVDLKSSGGKYTGDLAITVSNNTVRCDVELKQVN